MIFPQQNTPLAIPGMVCWFDADTTPTGAVASWSDKSGFNRHAVQGVGGQQLVCTANQQAGRNALLGVRASSSFALSTFGFTTSPNCTIFYAAQKTSISTGVPTDFMFDGIDSTNRQSLIDQISTHKFTFGTNTSTTGALADTNSHIHTMQGGTTGNYWIDRVAQFTDTNVGSLGLAGMTINARWTQANSSDIKIFEIIYYNRKLISAEILSVERYLANKWGIAIS